MVRNCEVAVIVFTALALMVVEVYCWFRGRRQEVLLVGGVEHLYRSHSGREKKTREREWTEREVTDDNR